MTRRPVTCTARSTPLAWLLKVGGSLAVAGCADSGAPLEPPVPPGGVIEVQVVQSGLLLNRVLGLKVDGVEKRVFRALGEAGAWDKQFVALGTHEVELTGVAPNCRVDGGTRVTANVGRMDGGKIVFHVRCAAEELLPEGRQAAFLLWHEPEGSNGFAGFTQLWLMGADGVARNTTRPVGDFAWAPGGDRLVVSYSDRAVVLDATGSVLTPAVFPEGVQVTALAWSPGGDAIAALLLDAERCRVMVAEGAGWTARRELECGDGGYPRAIDWAPGGDLLAIRHYGRDISILSTRTGQRTALPPISQVNFLTGIAWSPDGNQLAIAGAGNTGEVVFLLYDVATGSLRQQWSIAGLPSRGFPGEEHRGVLQWGLDGSSMLLGPVAAGPSAGRDDQPCDVVAVVPIADPSNWRPLLPCGLGTDGFSMPRGPLRAAAAP